MTQAEVQAALDRAREFRRENLAPDCVKLVGEVARLRRNLQSIQSWARLTLSGGEGTAVLTGGDSSPESGGGVCTDCVAATEELTEAGFDDGDGRSSERVLLSGSPDGSPLTTMEADAAAIQHKAFMEAATAVRDDIAKQLGIRVPGGATDDQTTK